MKKEIVLKSLNIDPVIYFSGTDEEIEQAERKEEKQSKIIENIIFSSDFQQLTYKTASGAIRSLHRSTRPGVMFQLSYIDPDGVPAMHENFIQTRIIYGVGAIQTKRDLIKHFVNQTLKKSLYLELITY